MKQQDLSIHCTSNSPPETRPTISLLPPSIASWLHTQHEELADALARVQLSADASSDDEPMLAIEELPDVTRKFLWHGMRRHHPDLAALVRDPNIVALRATFSASLQLRVSDLVQVICAEAADRER